MKKIFSFLAAFAIATNVAASTGSDLLQRLEKLQAKGVMFGHQDDPVYGCSWKWDEGRSDVLETAGDYPAIMGFDLGGLELGWEKNLEGVPFDRMQKEIVAQHERGGIITISWHAYNPTNDENSWFQPAGNAVTSILPGGALQPKYDKWLDKVVAFLAACKDKEGNVVPVIFRPWHEMSGGWFWWGATACTSQEYRQLFQYTHKYMTEKGCDNIVWAFSPNLADKEDVEHYMQFYPGDEYVDLIGIDVYQFSADNKVYQDNLRRELDVVKAVGEKQKKLIALTETGYQNVPDPQWFTQTLLPVVKEYPISYVLLWRNAWDNPKENYVAAPGKPTVKDFKKFCKDKKVLMCKDIKKTR